MFNIIRLYLAQYNWRKAALAIGSICFLFAALLFLSWLTVPSVEYSEAKNNWNAKREITRMAKRGVKEASERCEAEIKDAFNRVAEAQIEEGVALRELMLIRK
jgi:hypothetical protein